MSAIAIYEQDQLMHALLQEWLCSAGYHVLQAARPGSATDGSAPDGAAFDGTVDLAIVSICSPKHSGVHQLREIQSAHPKTPLIALSGQFRADLSSVGTTARALGVAQVIAKPLTRDALLGAVQAMIGPPN
jgi:DNA-binding response OmpR family regulator